jgi:hypothetical protein
MQFAAANRVLPEIPLLGPLCIEMYILPTPGIGLKLHNTVAEIDKSISGAFVKAC